MNKKHIIDPQTEITILKFCKKSDKIYEFNTTIEKWQKAKLDNKYRYLAFQVGLHSYQNTIKLRNK